MEIAARRWVQGEYEIDTDRRRLDMDKAHSMVANSYWGKGIPVDTFSRSVAGALCFGIYHGAELVGFARVISDYATIAYLGDVIIDPAHRGKGLSKWLMACIHGHPDLQGLRRWMLITSDAHGLYAQNGYTALATPERWMERHTPNAYQRTQH
ncbi:MAG: GNAT family N-acetyltransferase [Burkholderiales bacterium]|nr:GNAT family N-acetyltransferase [Burkholderiales bacterium]